MWPRAAAPGPAQIQEFLPGPSQVTQAAAKVSQWREKGEAKL